MRPAHDTLVGKSIHELRLICGEATHQHFKGGLYRYLGVLRDSETGVFDRTPDGDVYVAYEHVYPYDRQTWKRPYNEFFGDKDGKPRFRPLYFDRNKV